MGVDIVCKSLTAGSDLFLDTFRRWMRLRGWKLVCRPWGALLREHWAGALQQLHLFCGEPKKRSVRPEVPRSRVRSFPVGLDAAASRISAAVAGVITRDED